ncbi:Endosulphine [Penicillium bovifimosum]|uniref:mRNA stability protein n=1 Tax=Penicillium bovifimosum TaxID=126998 RepID=A0A9W9L427_9EURO|nr:Endosulphine [Penicillium bovifimosum]KAJ5135224.1 Endosulphine [Penicillium bovifimosum]
MQTGGPDPESLAKADERLLTKYGKLPRGSLLAQHSKQRMYFDSGDFALSAAHRETDNGAIQTGRAHPYRDSISHPYASIPASSNVNKDANQDSYRKSSSPEKSPLLHRTDMNDEPPHEERKDDHVSQDA